MIARALCSFALLVAVALHAAAQDETRKFRYRPKKIAIGTVYHYVKTNLDGTHPEYVSTYVASRDRIESYKFHTNTARAGLVIAWMDWETFSARRLESYRIDGAGLENRGGYIWVDRRGLLQGRGDSLAGQSRLAQF